MFQVIWTDPALTRLAELYVAATPEERERMAAGVERMNQQLRDDRPRSGSPGRTGGGSPFRLS